tara:strand:- start:2562 stop:3020 length:459 start_codon:yes stop_codon:yes gene_type:complete
MEGIIAIDPGSGGALAFITDASDYSEAYKCPSTTRGMFAVYNHCVSACYIDGLKPTVVVEKVWAFPTDARSNAFNFGVNYGKWLGIISSSNIKPILVTPKKWQNAYQPLSKDKPTRKRELKQIASEMFPEIRVTLYNCDALLIGAWAKSQGD